MPGFENSSLVGFIRNPSFHNIGFRYSSPTFTICSADGRDLSIYNPAYISINHPTIFGRIVNIKITENKTFEDANGTFSFGTQTAGTTASVAWGNKMPWFVYAVVNDSADDIIFYLNRAPNSVLSTATASMYQKGDSGGTSIEDSFILDSGLTKDDWNGNPVIPIGFIEMTKNSSDNWTFVSSVYSGVGKFPDRTDYLFPTGQNGATVGHLSSSDPLDTVPVFSGNSNVYRIFRNGFCFYTIGSTNITVSGSNNTTGGNLRLHFPYLNRASNINVYPSFTWNSGGSTFFFMFKRPATVGSELYGTIYPINSSGSVALKPGDATTARSTIGAVVTFQAF